MSLITIPAIAIPNEAVMWQSEPLICAFDVHHSCSTIMQRYEKMENNIIYLFLMFFVCECKITAYDVQYIIHYSSRASSSIGYK